MNGRSSQQHKSGDGLQESTCSTALANANDAQWSSGLATWGNLSYNAATQGIMDNLSAADAP